MCTNPKTRDDAGGPPVAAQVVASPVAAERAIIAVRLQDNLPGGDLCFKTVRSVAALCAALAALVWVCPVAAEPVLTWTTVVNNSAVAPDPTKPDSIKLFNSYSPASVNDEALVVFRGRTQGGTEGGAGGEGGGRISGVFQRDMKTLGPIQAIATQGSVVPQPNNLAATFNEFPSFARIDSGSNLMATRGQSQPVLEYQTGVDPVTLEPITTRAGTSGIYANPANTLTTGMSLLGAVPGYSQYQIPQPAVSIDALRFDQFPGAPAAFDGKYIAFKGNYTDQNAVGQTGVFYRDITGAGGMEGAVAIAWRGMAMPINQFVPTGTTFGSTSPPSAAKGKVVFTGLDNEEAPTAGGIYSVKVGQPSLTTLVSIGETVPAGTTAGNGNTLNRLGEGLSFDGRYVSFWGAWGAELRTITLTCPADGNADVRAACIAQSDKDANGVSTGKTTREVPLHQGIFQKDTVSGKLLLVAETGTDYEDFLFWNFSGNAGQGGPVDSEEEEGPRWRSNAFIAADGVKVVFKATEPAANNLPNIFGLYLDMSDLANPFALLTSAMFGQVLDSAAQDLNIVALSIERDSFRNGWLAVSASMADAESGWAGVYLTQVVPEPSGVALMVLALCVLALSRRWGTGQCRSFNV